MKKVTKFNFRTLLVLFLAITLCLSTALTVACDGKDSSSSSSSSSVVEEEVYPTDTQSVLNGDFEFSTFTKDADDFPVASSISWVRSSDSITSSAVSSSYTSGIIDTAKNVHSEYAKAAGLPVISKEGAEEVEYYNPLTPYDYGFISDDELFIFNEEENNENEDGLPMKGSKVLMLHNEVKGSDGKGNGEGTAQKFTSSSSLSLAKNEYAKLTVWVKTHNLVSKYYDNGEFGAYIAVQNTVSTATTPFVIKNINTGSQWGKYTIYLSSSDFATSSFKVVLGLGFGSKEIRRDYVEGFAFFDNVNFEIIDKAEYDEGINGVTEYNLYDENNEVKEELTANEAGVAFNDNMAEENDLTERAFLLSHTREDGAIAGIDLANGSTTHNDYGQEAGKFGYAELNAILEEKINADRAEEDKIVAPVESGKAFYFLHNVPTSSTHVTEKFTLAKKSFLKLSFWVKVETTDLDDVALTVTLNDLGTGSSEAVDTVIASNVSTNKFEDNENFGNWIEYVVYVSNTLDDNDRQFTLTFDFGTTEPFITDIPWSLTEGFAIITDPVGYYLSEEDYNLADVNTNTYAKKVTLKADLPNGVESEDENEDSYVFNHGINDDKVIETGIATNVVSYKGVVGGSTFVGGTTPTAYSDPTVVAGVVNSEFKSAYEQDIQDALNGLGALDGNTYVQPLMIKTTAGGKSFGYVGSGSTIAAKSTTIITVKVKVTGDAVAYIYLTNSNALDSFNVLGVDAQGKKVENGALVNDGEPLKRDFVIAITAADMANVRDVDNGWLTVKIAITAGDNAISYRTELWNGARDGETPATAGIVLFDDFAVTSATDNTAIIDELKAEYGEDPTVTKFTRVPTLITYTNNEGKEATKYTTYKESEVIYEFAKTKSLIVDLTTIDAVTEIDKTNASVEEEEEVPEETTSSDETSFSWALQITSIIIAAVLIALLIVVLVKMLVDKYGKKKNSSKDYYNRNSREQAGLAIEAKNARKKAQAEAEEAVEEEVKPYDYDNMDNNIDEEVVESEESEPEVASEEAVEEVTEEVAEETIAEATEDDKPEDAE